MHDPLLLTAADLIDKHFTALSPQSRDAFFAEARVVRASKGTYLVREGQYSDKLWFIVRGAVRAGYLKDGRDITDWFAFEHQFINSIQSYFMNLPSLHFIEVLETAELIEFSRSSIEKACTTHIEIERLARISITHTMIQLQQRIVGLQFEPAKQKLDNLLQLHPQIMQRVPLMYIASHLGITLETLSRIRSSKA
ncbi:MAG: Crp/Fnr family transcriptional regulator [Bacteroidia bacterium]